ncbi:hypothetical protein Taro_015690 [Colocasia esculenta]|uniref:Uncharacterized protein n=1 Tax=Colocasia esculenta TaxID=4460 RepID=A0A843UI46_COLES|nr:hypothetical protein [Colocasia esculenta]
MQSSRLLRGRVRMAVTHVCPDSRGQDDSSKRRCGHVTSRAFRIHADRVYCGCGGRCEANKFLKWLIEEIREVEEMIRRKAPSI